MRSSAAGPQQALSERVGCQLSGSLLEISFEDFLLARAAEPGVLPEARRSWPSANCTAPVLYQLGMPYARRTLHRVLAFFLAKWLNYDVKGKMSRRRSPCVSERLMGNLIDSCCVVCLVSCVVLFRRTPSRSRTASGERVSLTSTDTLSMVSSLSP